MRSLYKKFCGFWLVVICIFSFNAFAKTSLVMDQDYFPTLISELNKAETSIDILSFSFAIDNGSGTIQPNNQAFFVARTIAEIKAKKGNEIQIRLFIEGARNTADRNKITADYLEKAGVIVKYGSTHAKGFSIDHKKIFFGSTNLTTQSMMKNNETNILSDDTQIIKGFDLFFDNLWSGGIHDSLKLETPMIADSSYKEALLNAIRTAKTSLSFSIYYFNDSEIEKALIEAFTQRGIHVRGYFNQHKTFALDLVEKNRHTVKRMRAEGLNDLHFDLDTMFSHSKYIIKDNEEILLGTGNWNRSDVEIHRQLYIHLKDSELATELSQHLDEQIRLESDPTQ